MTTKGRIVREGQFGSFHALLSPIERVDPEEVKRLEEERDIDRRREAAYEEGQARGYRDGYDQGYEFGHAKGHSEGVKAGQDEFAAEHDGALQVFRASLAEKLEQFEQAREAWFRAAEARYADIALEVARRALANELATGRESVLAIAREVLSETRAGTSVRVRVNPSDVGMMEAHRPELLAALTNLRGLEVVADNSVDGGVVVESEDGLVDARVSTFLERIVQVRQREVA